MKGTETMSNKLRISDRMFLEDSVGDSPRSGFWARTQIIGGYGLKHTKTGICFLDEVIFEEENMVPLTGVQYAMEMIFGVKGTLELKTLNQTMQIGAQGSALAPSQNMPYPYGQRVCLFGVGTGGTEADNKTVKAVKYNDVNVSNMVPIRYTNDSLSSADQKKYFGKKEVSGTTAYYLKAFDTEPAIKHVYKNMSAEYDEWDEHDPVTGDVFDGDLGTKVIMSFAEQTLTLGKNDLKEWAKAQGGVEDCIVNSIGLFSGVHDASKSDYANIMLFSKLNVRTEPFSGHKDMTIIYRVYGA